MKFCHFPTYVRTRAAGIPKGRGSPVATSKCLHFGALDRADRRETAPWHTDFGTKSSVLHLARGVQAPGTHIRSDCPQTRHIGGRPSSHKANLVPQNKRQDTIATMIPCLCLFTALRTLIAELVGARPLHLLTQTVLLLSQTQTSDKQKTYPNPFSQRRVRVRTVWWRIRDSNPRPPACDAGALTS